MSGLIRPGAASPVLPWLGFFLGLAGGFVLGLALGLVAIL